MPNKRLRYLFERFTQGISTPAENRELYALVMELQHEQYVQELLDEYWDTQKIELRLPADKSEWMAEAILHQQPGDETIQPANVRRMGAIWKRIAVAASIILIVGLGSYFLFFNNTGLPAELVQSGAPAHDVKAPGNNRAMITLASGQIIFLDSAVNGSLAMIENVQLVKEADGKIVYSGSADEIVYNTLTNPRGSKVIDMTLADGSRVWLNAGSSVTYPVAFINNERKISISGEAYFEVAHDATKPFKVTKGDLEVAVFGTHFNVNAYDDEREIKVTLLEGSVKVSIAKQRYPSGDQADSSIILKPGQQSIYTLNAKLSKQNNVDIEEVMAWKNGSFKFHDVGIEKLMRELARWYDVEIVYESKPTKIFRGGMPRNMNAAKVFRILEETGGVHFRIEGKKVIVMN